MLLPRQSFRDGSMRFFCSYGEGCLSEKHRRNGTFSRKLMERRIGNLAYIDRARAVHVQGAEGALAIYLFRTLMGADSPFG